MRQYYLFIIKDYESYKKNSDRLYNILYKLYTMKSDYNYGIYLYNQICKCFNVEILSDYLSQKYKTEKQNIYYINKVLIRLYPSRIIIDSPYNLPNIIKIFDISNKHIFVCDFKNKDYFWLNDFIKTKSLEYV